MKQLTIIAILWLMVLATLSTALAVPEILWDFESGDGEWKTSDVDAGNISVGIAGGGAGNSGHALAIAGKVPKSFGAKCRPWHNWRGLTTLQFDIKVPQDAPRELDLYVYVKDRQYLWFQTAPLHDMKTGKQLRQFTPGKWATFTIDISEDSTVWEPGGHERSWDRVLYYPREFGLRFFSAKEWSGVVLLDNIRLSGDEPPVGPMKNGKPGPGQGTLDARANTDRLKVYQKFEITFDMDRDYENPFDPSVVDVAGHFLLPDGTRREVPGFYYQDYRRTRTEDGWEKLIPVGAPCWKVRFAPGQAGTYKCFVQLSDALGQYRSQELTFTALADHDQPGMVRISKQDPRYFEFENGDFFFPTGINMRDGGDHAQKQKGTYDFDYYFDRFQEEKLNFVRTWMCGWWVGIEWSDEYHSRYDDVGRYCLYNGWRFDYMLDLAAERGIYLEITLNSHGQFRRDKFDAEWGYNPYSVKNGGFVASPAMFFRSTKAKEMIEQRNRYTVARWGYSPNIMSWDLVNEVDLSEGYNKPEVAAWHAEMARYIKSVDINDHLITSHICLYWGYGTELWDLPEIQYVQADAYWKRESEEGMNECWQARRHYNKPFLFIEYGPQTASLPIPENNWQRDFRVGMWVSNLIPSAAPGQFWYHREWQQYGLYEYQKGLLAYNDGEDRRGMRLQTVSAKATSAGPNEITVQAMSNGEYAYFYAYDFANMLQPSPEAVPAARQIDAAEVMIGGFKPGRYLVEYRDTLTGEIITANEVTVSGAALKVALPHFAQDIAAKIKPM
jgi:hypothetical protein